jgi:hypothetical protein
MLADKISSSLIFQTVFGAVYTIHSGGMRHTSTALFFYRASRKSLLKPRTIFRNMLLQINYTFNYSLQILPLQFQKYFKKSLLASK